MTKESLLDCERKNFDKLKNYQLPNKFKKFGWLIFGIAFIALFLTVKGTPYKMIAKYTMLFGLLIVSLSKEKIEDELIRDLRLQSFTFSFIATVFITITNPIFSYLINFFTTKQQEVFNSVGDWTILWFLLSVQVFCFEFIKKLHR